jgi:hypothetical protein
MPLLNVEIDETLLREFRAFAAAKHGRLYNALRPEVELALESHLALQKAGTGRKATKPIVESPEMISDKPEGGSQ